jgi:hypothetical protein
VTSGAGGAWSSETAWSQSGGGISPDGIPIPAWQAGVANSSNGGSATLRNVPDVAMEANPDSYYCDFGQCNIGWLGGTSLAAPRWAAFIALVNQQASEAGEPPVGFLNPFIYSIASGPDYFSDFHDMVSGSNDYNSMCHGAQACNTAPGFDLVTGWGSPTGQALIDALAPPAPTGFQISSSVMDLTINPGSYGTTTIEVLKHGGFNGSVNLAISGLPSDVTSSWGTNPTTGSSLLRLDAASTAARGSYGVTITGTSGSFSATTRFTLAVNARGFAIFPSPGSLRIHQGASESTAIEVANYAGFSGNVSLAVTSQLPQGVTATWSPASNGSLLTLTASDTAVLTEGTNVGRNIPITITGSSGDLSATNTVTVAILRPSAWLFLSPSFLPVSRGESATATLTAVPWGTGTGSYDLRAYGQPSGVTVSFNPPSIFAGETSQVTVTTDATTPLGLSGPAIQAIPRNGGDQTTSGLGLVVTDTPQPTASVSFSPGYVVLQQGGSSTVNVTVNTQHGFSGTENFYVYPQLPTGVTASLSASSSSSSSILTFTASAAAQPGFYSAWVCYSIDPGACIHGSTTPSYSVDIFLLVQPASTFSLSSSTASLPVVPNGSATSTITVVPLAGFTGHVQLSIASPLTDRCNRVVQSEFHQRELCAYTDGRYDRCSRKAPRDGCWYVGRKERCHSDRVERWKWHHNCVVHYTRARRKLYDDGHRCLRFWSGNPRRS